MGKSGDLETELAQYLNAQEKLRGRVRLTGKNRPTPGMSQPVSTIVLELLGPTGVVFAAAAIAWLRHRTADTKITVRRPDGVEFEISAQRVRRLGPKELSALAEQIAEMAGGPTPHRPAGPEQRAAEPAGPDEAVADEPETPSVDSGQADGFPAALAELQHADDV